MKENRKERSLKILMAICSKNSNKDRKKWRKDSMKDNRDLRKDKKKEGKEEKIQKNKKLMIEMTPMLRKFPENNIKI